VFHISSYYVNDRTLPWPLNAAQSTCLAHHIAALGSVTSECQHSAEHKGMRLRWNIWWCSRRGSGKLLLVLASTVILASESCLMTLGTVLVGYTANLWDTLLVIVVFCVVTPCSLVSTYRRFWGTCCLRSHGWSLWVQENISVAQVVNNEGGRGTHGKGSARKPDPGQWGCR
jgi:hypothetical protein